MEAGAELQLLLIMLLLLLLMLLLPLLMMLLLLLLMLEKLVMPLPTATPLLPNNVDLFGIKVRTEDNDDDDDEKEDGVIDVVVVADFKVVAFAATNEEAFFKLPFLLMCC